MTNRDIIKDIIQNGNLEIIRLYKQSSELVNSSNCFFKDYIESAEKVQLLNDFYERDVVDVYSKYFHAQYQKIKRIKKFILDTISEVDDYNENRGEFEPQKIIVFVTLTLSDTYFFRKFDCDYQHFEFCKDNYNVVRTDIREFVAEYSDRYVLNKDFGLHETKRLHFHGIIVLNKEDLDKFLNNYIWQVKNEVYNFGFCTLEEIDNHSDFISIYITKLSYHALKVDYGYNRENLIYSRRKRK